MTSPSWPFVSAILIHNITYSSDLIVWIESCCSSEPFLDHHPCNNFRKQLLPSKSWHHPCIMWLFFPLLFLFFLFSSFFPFFALMRDRAWTIMGLMSRRPLCGIDCLPFHCVEPWIGSFEHLICHPLPSSMLTMRVPLHKSTGLKQWPPSIGFLISLGLHEGEAITVLTSIGGTIFSCSLSVQAEDQDVDIVLGYEWFVLYHASTWYSDSDSNEPHVLASGSQNSTRPLCLLSCDYLIGGMC